MVLKLFRPNDKLSDFNSLSLEIVSGFTATLSLTNLKQLLKENKPQQAYHKNKGYLSNKLSTLRTTNKQHTKEHTSTKERASTLRTIIKEHTKQLILRKPGAQAH